MIDFDFKDKNQIYQLIAGLSGFTVILIGALIVMAPFFPAKIGRASCRERV